jgi:hypothetical protein
MRNMHQASEENLSDTTQVNAEAYILCAFPIEARRETTNGSLQDRGANYMTMDVGFILLAQAMMRNLCNFALRTGGSWTLMRNRALAVEWSRGVIRVLCWDAVLDGLYQ